MSLKEIKSKNFTYTVFLVVFLGLLSAFAPFVTDMYLPTLPALETEFNTSVSMIQLGLTTSMIGLAMGQVFFGPISDRCGRRPILVVSLLLFCVATILCVLSAEIEMFLAMRLLQGLGASGGIVLSRSVATDIYSGRELAKMMAIIGAVNGVAPVTAPVIGGVVASVSGWQGIFVVLCGIGLLLLAMTIRFRESLSSEKKSTAPMMAMFKNYGKLLTNREFMGYVLAFAFSQGVLFSYIAAAPFIVQHDFGFSELIFSLIFGINAIGIGIGSAASMKFSSMRSASFFGAMGMWISALTMLLLNIFVRNFWCYELTTWVMLFAMGFIFTGATTIAMEKGRQYIGVASATIGASGFLIGGLVSPLVGFGDNLVSCPVVCLVCATISILSLRWAKKS